MSFTYTAADEIDRRAANKLLKGHGKHIKFPEGADKALLASSGPELKALAGIVDAPKEKSTPKAESKKVPGTHPMKGKSRLGLTAAQQERQKAIYAEIGGGARYHEACKAEGIPTSKNGLATV